MKTITLQLLLENVQSMSVAKLTKGYRTYQNLEFNHSDNLSHQLLLSINDLIIEISSYLKFAQLSDNQVITTK